MRMRTCRRASIHPEGIKRETQSSHVIEKKFTEVEKFIEFKVSNPNNEDKMKGAIMESRAVFHDLAQSFLAQEESSRLESCLKVSTTFTFFISKHAAGSHRHSTCLSPNFFSQTHAANVLRVLHKNCIYFAYTHIVSVNDIMNGVNLIVMN